MRLLDRTTLEQLEAMVDTNGLQAVLTAIAGICHEKAEHIRSHWQDRPLAQTWNRDGNKIERLKVEN